MIIDSSGGLPPPQTFDILIKKNLETEDPRAIEDSDKSNDSKLDANRQNIAQKQAGDDMSKDIGVESETHNDHDNSVVTKPTGNSTDYQQKSIDLIV